MFARVVTFQRASSNNVDEANRIAREQVVPLMRQQAGYRGVCVLTDRASGKQLGISFWDTAEQARGSANYNAFRDQTSQELADTAPPVTEVFEVELTEQTGSLTSSAGAVMLGSDTQRRAP